jgi:sortase A
MKGAKGGRLVRRVAATFVGTGILLLSFVAYQLWGTALYEHSAQNHLRQELAGKLQTPPTVPSSAPGAPSSTPPGGTTPTTTAPGTTFVNHVAPTTSDPKAGTPIGLLTIPKIGMSNAAIVEGTQENQLQQGPGHYLGTSLPGQAGNAAIAGHRTTYGAPFYSLNALQPGDDIKIETSQGFYDYQVVTSHVVSPTNTTVLESSTTPMLTLTTCNPRYSAATRLVVVASLKTALTAVAAIPTTPPGSTPTSAPTPPTTLPPTLAGGDEGLAGVNARGEVVRAIVWASLAALAALIGSVAFRRGRRPWTWAVLATGVPLTVGALLVCFQHVSLALPQSF